MKSTASSVTHPSNLPSIPPSSNSTVHLLGTLGQPHSMDEEQALLPVLVGWDVFWPRLADPDNVGHTLSWQVCLDFSLQRSPERSLQPRRAGALSCAGGTRSLDRNELDTPLTDTCVWGLCHLATWLNWAAIALTLFNYCSPGIAFHAIHKIPKWYFFLACRVCLASVWQNKKIRNRRE